MFADLKFFVKTIIRDISNPSSPKTDDEIDPKNLRIRIPKCTYVTCHICKEDYIKEHSPYSCPCLNPNE